MTPQPLHRRARHVAIVAATALLFPLLPLGAMAGAHRDAPNNPCDPDTPPAGFTDRGAIDDVHRANVDCIASLGVAEGRDGPTGLEYAPDATVLRGQMASFVARSLEAAGHDLPAPSDQGFEDVQGNVHEDRINQLAEIDVVFGRNDDQYAPNQAVRRDQLAAYLMRAASWAHDHEYEPVAAPQFDDTEGNIHVRHIQSAYEMWVVAGRTPTSYDPAGAVQREAMGSFLSRLVDLIHPENYQTTNQTHIVAPQQAITTDAGDPFEFTVGARYDGRPFTGPIDIVLIPCANAEPTDSPVVFRDLDDDGLADDFASTNEDQAYISAVNGIPLGGPELHVPDAEPAADGTLEFTVVSPAADCAVPVVFQPRTDEGFRLDAGQRPAGPFGVGQITWT